MMNERILLITGSTSDIGQNFIEKSVDDYDLIYMHYNHSDQIIKEFCNKYGDKILPIQADFSREEDIYDMLEIIQRKEKYPNYFLHLASPRIVNVKFHKCNWINYQNYVNACLRSAVILLEGIIPYMQKKKFGKIIFMLSADVVGTPPKFQSPYVTMKYSLLGLMKSLAVEYASKGITVNAISPEMVETKFLDDIPEIVIQANADSIPIGRNLVVSDIVPTIQYLFSEGADTISGQNISITAGKILS